MIKRPLCFLCLIFLIIQGIILIMRGGQSVMEMPASSIFQLPEGQGVSVTGQVYNKKTTPNTQIIFLKINSNSNQEKIIIYDSDFTKIYIGQIIQIQGSITHFDRAHNPGNFDQAFYYAKEGIYGALFCEHIAIIDDAYSNIKESLYELKCFLKESMVNAMGKEHGNVLAAMILGEKSEMDAEIKEAYQKSGIGHVLAISGLHISFIGLGVYQVLRKLKLPFGIAGMLAIGVLTIYTCMVGTSVSVFRAYVMLLFKIGADMTGRIYDMLTALMFAAALTVWKQPLYLMDAGFYLSYGAILGIVLYRLAGLHLTLLPIQLWYYFEFPTYSILLNLIVIPLMSLVLILGIAGSMIIILVPTWGQGLLYLCKWILFFYEEICQLTIHLPSSRMVAGRPEIWEMVFYYIIMGLFVSGVIKRKTLKILALVISILVLFYTPAKDLQITMMDVGQGDGIFMEGPTGTTYFIDGGSSDVKEVGKYRLEPFLKYEGAGTLDYVFISHGDGDHYNGIMEMLCRQDVGVRIKNLVLPENYKEDTNLLTLAKTAKEQNSKILVMKAGTVLTEEELEITCIQPDKDSHLLGNPGSMVLNISYGKFDMLCTGDVEEQGEELLNEKIRGKEYDVLKVSHHGSKYSTEKEFLDAVSVKTALISAGNNNQYGHPHEETIKRLEQEGCNIYQTTECGAITIRTDGKQMRVEVFH